MKQMEGREKEGKLIEKEMKNGHDADKVDKMDSLKETYTDSEICNSGNTSGSDEDIYDSGNATDLNENTYNRGNVPEFDEDIYDPDNDPDEDDAPAPDRRWLKRLIAIMLSAVMLVNVLAFWPQVYSLDAIQFLLKSSQLSQDDAIQSYKKAVVIVKAGDRKGTGYNIADDGLIITNYHVVEGASSSIFIHFSNGKSFVTEVVAWDPVLDLAALKVKEDAAQAADLPILRMASQVGDDPGTPVYVIGNPLFFNRVANEGKTLGMLSEEEPQLMMIQAPIYKGNSGSPVIGADGEVIAVIFATTKIQLDKETRTVGLAVPIQYVQAFLESKYSNR